MKTETCKLYGLLNFLPNVKIDPYRFKVGSFFETVYMSECRTCRKFIFFGEVTLILVNGGVILIAKGQRSTSLE